MIRTLRLIIKKANQFLSFLEKFVDQVQFFYLENIFKNFTKGFILIIGQDYGSWLLLSQKFCYIKLHSIRKEFINQHTSFR